MVSSLRKNLPFGLRTDSLLLTNQVLQIPVGCIGPPPARASGQAFEIMKAIIMSLKLLPLGGREVKLPMESSHLTHSRNLRIRHHRSGCTPSPPSYHNFAHIFVLFWSSVLTRGISEMWEEISKALHPNPQHKSWNHTNVEACYYGWLGWMLKDKRKKDAVNPQLSRKSVISSSCIFASRLKNAKKTKKNNTCWLRLSRCTH